MRKLIFLASLLCCFCVVAVELAAANENQKAASRPNVLFIAVDDLNDWTSCLGGHPQSKTPNIDRLASRGVLFTRAYCSAPACNPSRVSLLSGLRPSTTGVYRNDQPFRMAEPDAVTLPQYFMANGYNVAGCGKIYHGRFPDRPSWNEYQKRILDPTPRELPANGIAGTAHFDWGPVDVGEEAMGDYKTVDWAARYLERKHDKPFFLAVGLFRPHLPWYVPQKYFDQHPAEDVVLPQIKEDDYDDLPRPARALIRGGDHRNVTLTDNWHKAVAGYLASIAFTDEMVGRLLSALEASAYAKNTIIVLWGDHGWHLGEKHHWRKFALWEEATRVPLIIYAPGVTPAGERCGRTVSLLDLYPTLVELCDLPKKYRLEGRSIVSLLKDPEKIWRRPVVTTHRRNNHAVRSEKWRYIRYADGSEELYNHETDPMEWENVASDPANKFVKAGLAMWLPEKNAKPSPRFDPSRLPKNRLQKKK